VAVKTGVNADTTGLYGIMAAKQNGDLQKLSLLVLDANSISSF
jgi:hypothetical protein